MTLKRHGPGLAALALTASACASQPAPNAPEHAVSKPVQAHHRSDATQRTALGLTVYNSNFALVRERRQIALGTGRVALEFQDVAAHIQPATVVVQSLEAAGGLIVLEQNYRYDLLTPSKLLEKHVGETIRVARYDPRLGREEMKRAEVLAAVNGPVLRIDGEISTGEWTRYIFPRSPEDLLPRPTLVWLLESARASQTIELSYVTEKISWRADYVLVLDGDTTRGDLNGWVTLDNQSGASFPGARLDLVAGDVRRVAQPQDDAAEMFGMGVERVQAQAHQFSEQELFEYHQYSLGRSADVLDKEQKQISLLEARNVPLRKKLRLDGFTEGFRARMPEPLPAQKVSVLVSLDNEAEHGLGVPLPKGVVRVYQADAQGAAQFVGEDEIDHTPRDEELELELGHAFDVVAERKQVGFRSLGSCSSESEWKIELRNHKDQSVSVEVVEPAFGDYEVSSASHPVRERDAERFAFDVPVAARSSQELTFTVRVRWC